MPIHYLQALAAVWHIPIYSYVAASRWRYHETYSNTSLCCL